MKRQYIVYRILYFVYQKRRLLRTVPSTMVSLLLVAAFLLPRLHLILLLFLSAGFAVGLLHRPFPLVFPTRIIVVLSPRRLRLRNRHDILLVVCCEIRRHQLLTLYTGGRPLYKVSGKLKNLKIGKLADGVKLPAPAIISYQF